jgi:uncharacterized Zn-binding protein involved in type VI secretion
MSRAVIRLGDYTSHGGRVIEATARMTIDGIPVALWGDHCSCPIPGHDNCVICEGEVNAMFDGRPVALEGHKTTCGSVLSASQHDRCTVSPLVKQSVVTGPSNVADVSQSIPTSSSNSVFDEQIQLIDQSSGQPLSDVEYKVVAGSGQIFTGKTGSDGKTMRIQTESIDQLRVFLVE